jgi:hypothetical protein
MLDLRLGSRPGHPARRLPVSPAGRLPGRHQLAVGQLQDYRQAYGVAPSHTLN